MCPFGDTRLLKCRYCVKRFIEAVKGYEDGFGNNAESSVRESSNMAIPIDRKPFQIRAGTNAIGGGVEGISRVVCTNHGKM